MTTAPAYAIGYLRDVRMGPDIATYMQQIDATLDPFGGQFLVHGGTTSPREGEWDGDLIIIAFPSIDAAADWYASPDYQAILPLRTRNSEGMVTLVEGVQPGHRGVDKLSEVLAADA